MENKVLYDEASVLELFENLRTTSSLNSKKEILQAGAENTLFLQTLEFLLNPHIITGISTKKMEKKINPIPKNNNPVFTSISHRTTIWEKCMDYLLLHKTGTDEDIAVIKGALEKYPEKLQSFFKQIVTKSYKIGCDSKTVNQVIPNLIPTFEVMLGTGIEKCKLAPNSWISISQKLNGTRCVFYRGELYTRQGKRYTGLSHVIHDLNELLSNFIQRYRLSAEPSDFVVDGELVYKNTEGLSDSQAFQIGTGIANSKERNKTELKLVIFDILTKKEFDAGESQTLYSKRRIALTSLKDLIHLENLPNVDVVTLFYEGTDHSKIWKYLDYAEEHDMEGVMVNLDRPYQCKRTKDLMKVKKFFDCDLRCIGVGRGTGRNADKLGYIICSYKGHELRCGSGFTDDDRIEFWKYPDKVIGKTVTIKYKEETANKNGGVSLQFPVFAGVRFDKDSPDY